MGLFDKKYCDICGEKIGLLGNRKLENGNLCKDCAKQLSPFFSERRRSTVEEIREQLNTKEINNHCRLFSRSSLRAQDKGHGRRSSRQFIVTGSQTGRINPTSSAWTGSLTQPDHR